MKRGREGDDGGGDEFDNGRFRGPALGGGPYADERQERRER